MKRGLLGALVIAATVGVTAVIMLPSSSATSRTGVQERWINANLVQVQVDGTWRDVPMVPLADHICASNDPMYSRYCD